MRFLRAPWVAIVFLFPVVGALAEGDALACSTSVLSPPCGPINPNVYMTLTPEKNVKFGEKTELVLEGFYTYTWDIDSDGAFFDPATNPSVEFTIEKSPPWVEASVEPKTFTVPLSDPQYYHTEPSGQAWFEYKVPYKVTLKHKRDPTPKELEFKSKILQFRTGQALIQVDSKATASYMAPGVLPSWGLQEGYGSGISSLIPEIGGVAYFKDKRGVMRPQGYSPGNPEESPGLGAGMAACLVLVAVSLRRRD